VTKDKIQGGSTPSCYCPNYCFQRQLTCLSLPSPNYTQLLHPGRSKTRCSFLIFFQRQLLCVLLSWPRNPNSCTCISAQSFLFFCPACMCIIFTNQYHTSPICMNAVVIMFCDYLYVSHYHDPVTHEYSVYHRPIVLFLGKTYMFIISVAQLHISTTCTTLTTCTTRISAQLFFFNDN
jgi:hypothetical protein